MVKRVLVSEDFEPMISILLVLLFVTDKETTENTYFPLLLNKKVLRCLRMTRDSKRFMKNRFTSYINDVEYTF